MALSFDEFFTATYRSAVERCRAESIAPHVAEDCVQEAYVRAYTRWYLLRHYDYPLGWVLKVARNLALDERKRETRAGKAVRSLEQLTAEPVEHPLTDEVRAAVAALPDQQRRAITIYYGGDLSTVEGAARMGVAPGTFRFHLSQARAAIRPGLTRTECAEEGRDAAD